MRFVRDGLDFDITYREIDYKLLKHSLIYGNFCTCLVATELTCQGLDTSQFSSGIYTLLEKDMWKMKNSVVCHLTDQVQKVIGKGNFEPDPFSDRSRHFSISSCTLLTAGFIALLTRFTVIFRLLFICTSSLNQPTNISFVQCSKSINYHYFQTSVRLAGPAYSSTPGG